jgi:hypothetical protein
MRRTKLVGIAAAALAMLGGPLGAAPAHAGCVYWACETVFDAADYLKEESIEVYGNVLGDVASVYDAVGRTVVGTACDVFPSAPECT